MSIVYRLVDVVDANASADDTPEDYDPTPWCLGCHARRQQDCDCGPIAENN